MKKILEIEIERDRANRVIRLSQIIYIRKILQELDMKKNKHRDKIDIPLNDYDDISSAGPDEQKIDSIDYSRVIEKLMHMIIYTRPDIAFALEKLSQFMSNLAIRYDHGVKTLLRYLRFNADMSIVYRRDDKNIIRLINYFDIDYTADIRNRKSTIEQVFMLNSDSIS